MTFLRLVQSPFQAFAKHECNTDVSLYKVPDKFSRQGVNKEFQWVSSHCSLQIIINFLLIYQVM